MAESSYAELEIGLHQWNRDSYTAELRFSDPASFGVTHATFQGVRFDAEALRKASLDATAYGRQLTRALFHDSGLLPGFVDSCARADEKDLPLRLRLVVGPSAPQLHTLRWETLHDPRADDGRGLATNERIVFSRYLSSAGYTSASTWKRVRKRRRSELTALVMIAAPAGLGSDEPDGWSLAPVEVEVERERAAIGLNDIPTTYLVEPERATLDNLVGKLRDGPDILYLVSHGAFVGDEAHLYLEDDAGNVAVTSGSELAGRLQDLTQLPRLVVLVSCQSAGTGTQQASGDDPSAYLRALGPRLAEAGVPAVLAMQGDFSMESAGMFMPAFYRELGRHGQIDRAVAAARGAIRTRHDHWMPVLFMRLGSGSLWYVPRLEGSTTGVPGMVSLIEEGNATPILGPGMTDALLGSWRDIASGLATKWGFPLAPHDQSDLPQVAQFLSVSHNRSHLRRQIHEHLKEAIVARHGDNLDPDGDERHATLRALSLTELSSAVFKQEREKNAAEPHTVLASLPFSLYVTTNLGNALFDALEAAGKHPQRVICSGWKDPRPGEQAPPPIPSIYDTEPDYYPSADRPMIFHMFGHLDHPGTVVLTEDDYFDYLIGVTRHGRPDQLERSPIPFVVRGKLVSSGLLFLGFRPDDWAFRVLFRYILGQEGSGGLEDEDISHVAVQLEPDEDDVLSPARAMSYLTKFFFNRVKNTSVFWGSVEDFARELAAYQAGQRT